MSTNQNISTFLTFSGNAEEAMRFYVSLFLDSKVVDIIRIGKDDQGEDGKILHCIFELKGQKFMAMDMDKADCPPCTWAMSLYVQCATEGEFDMLAEKLSSDGGKALTGPKPTLNLTKAAWVTDKFGVTWHLALE